jgi:hypothetical protein
MVLQKQKGLLALMGFGSCGKYRRELGYLWVVFDMALPPAMWRGQCMI